VSPSQFTKWSTELIPELDWLSLGTFVCSLEQDALPFADGATSVDTSKLSGGNAGLVTNLLTVSKSVKAGYDPRGEEFLKPPLDVKLEGQKFVFNDFHVDWSDGILVGYGATDIGFRVSDSSVFITGEGAELALGADGLTLTDSSDDWCEGTVNVGPSGVTLEWGPKSIPVRYKIQLGPDGLTWDSTWLGKLSLGPRGVEIGFEANKLAILDGNLEMKFDGIDAKEKPTQKFEGGNVVITLPYTNRLSLGKSGLVVENVFQSLNLGPEGLKLHLMSLDFNILLSPPSLFMAAGPATLALDANGLDIELGDNSFHAGSDGVVFSAEGLTLTINADGVKLENDNPGVDLSAYTLPKISPKFSPPKVKTPPLPPTPKPPMPGVPGVPSIPSIPKMPSLGGGEKAGKVEDHLKPGETVKEEVDIVKRKMLFAKRTVHLIRTSTDRLFFCSELYGEKRGDDLVLGRSSNVEQLKDNTIKLTTADGKTVALTFKNAADRDPWVSKFQDIIRSLK
jgi:hypothetical protein